MKRRKQTKYNIKYILNDLMIFQIVYILINYIELITTNQIQGNNKINIYLYILLILIINLVKRLERKAKCKR